MACEEVQGRLGMLTETMWLTFVHADEKQDIG